MNLETLLDMIDRLLEISRYFNYPSEEEYTKHVENLLKMREKLLKNPSKCLKKGAEIDDS